MRATHKFQAAVALCVAAAVAWFLRGGTDTITAKRATRTPTSYVAATIPATPARNVAAAPALAAPLPCRQQKIALTLDDGKTKPVCVGATNTAQNGSVRTYSVETTDEPRQWLRIEVAGGRVMSAVWGGGDIPAGNFECAASACDGITLGKRDSQGVRIISLKTAILTREAADERNASKGRISITGALQTLAEQQIPGLACTDQGISITSADGSAAAFCPKGGAGFEIGANGGRVYRFSSLEGESVLVGVARDQQVHRVEYLGESSHVCVEEACANVRVSGLDASGARTVTFTGTTLVETSQGNGNTTLNGTLKVPPLE